MFRWDIAQIVFYIVILASFQIFAQNDFIFNGDTNHKIHINKNLSSTPTMRNDINFVSKKTTGEWKVFKNWNEGRAVIAENDSIVWVGTPVGLVWWNVSTGEYRTFDENNGLNFTAINSLAIDKTGKLWIAATQGLAVYSNGTFIHYNHNNTPLPEAGMMVVCIDNSNRVVVAFGPPLSGGYYQDGGIARFDGNTWQIWSYGQSIYWGPTFAMTVYQDTVWITGGQDLFVLTNDTFDRAPGWTFGGSFSLVVDYQDSLWVETGRKTVKRTSNGWEVIIDRDKEGMGSLFYDIWNDPRGGLWLSLRNIWWSGTGPFRLDIDMRRQGQFCDTQYAGICTIPGIPGQFYAQYAVNENLQFFVSEGIGTSWPENQVDQGGLIKFDGLHWEIFRIPTTILENEIYGLGSGKNGNILLSTPFYTQKTNGLDWGTIGEWGGTGVDSWNRDFRYAPNDSLFTNHHQGIPHYDFVKGLDFDGYGNLWFTYPLTRLSWPNFSQTTFTNDMLGISDPFHPQFMDVIVDKNENVWAAA